MIQYPHNEQCKRVYRWIQAHTAIRTSTRVGNELRSIAGAGGDVGAFSHSLLVTRFSGNDLCEAERLVQLAIHNRRAIRNGENNGQGSLSND